MCTISVIIPVYNAENTLKKCVESILLQSFADFELILVDDGSKDGSCELCDSFAQADKRVVVFHKINEGVCATRNFGLDRAKGEYVCFADSDDYVSPDWLKLLIQGIKNHPNSLVLSNVLMVEPDKQYLRYQCLQGECDHNEIWQRAGWGYSCNKIYRRDIIEQNHIRYDISLRVYEDELFVARYGTHTRNAFVIPEVGYYYVLSNQFEDKYWKDLNFEYMTYQYLELKKYNKRCSEFTVDRLVMFAYHRIIDDKSTFDEIVESLRNLIGTDIRYVKGGRKFAIRWLCTLNFLCAWKIVFKLYTTFNII